MGALDRAALAGVSPIVRRTVLVPTPAVGADWSVDVPGDQAWRILAIRAQLLTSAAAGNRFPQLSIDDGNVTVESVQSGAAHPANTGVSYSWIPGLGYQHTILVNATAIGLQPGLVLGPGQGIVVFTLNRDVGDAWSNIRVWIEQVPVGISAWALAHQAIEDVYEEPTAFL